MRHRKISKKNRRVKRNKTIGAGSFNPTQVAQQDEAERASLGMSQTDYTAFDNERTAKAQLASEQARRNERIARKSQKRWAKFKDMDEEDIDFYCDDRSNWGECKALRLGRFGQRGMMFGGVNKKRKGSTKKNRRVTK
jgi:hypothetical protein